MIQGLVSCFRILKTEVFMPILLGFTVALIINLVLTPLVLWIARKNEWFDKVNSRKIHSGQIPRLGGIGIFYSFVLTLLIVALSGLGVFESSVTVFWSVVAGAFIVHLVGLIDDFYDLPAMLKFLLQSIAAILVISAGFRFRVIFVPWGSGILEFGILSYPLTYLWIVGVTNALNLVDGMDGLAGTVASIASACFGILFLLKGDIPAAVLCFTLMGALLGFLVYNRHPARIFMGDSGSLAIGFVLSVLPLLGQSKESIEIGFLSAVVVLAIPIYDTLAAMTRRAISGKGLFKPDKEHIHHKLLSLGLGPRKSLGVYFTIGLLLSACALSTSFLEPLITFIAKVGILLVLLVLLLVLRTLTKKRR
jgi:UDP-GlcNAc:undecaprenyl-phosphate GlcNAc-1-phosphate transferase